MQLMPVLLLAVVMAVDGGLKPLGSNWNLPDWFIALMACAPVAIIITLAWIGMRHCERLMTQGWAGIAIMRSDRILRWSRWAILANHVFVVLVLGWLGIVRNFFGDVIVLDEFAAIVPPLLGLVALWWINYPLDRRLRDALLIRRLDEGRPVYPTLTRFSYVTLQLRLQVLLMLVPLLLIVGLVEAIERSIPGAGAAEASLGGIGWRELATLGAAAGVFLFSPLLARYILDVQPLPVGEVRNDLQSVCDRHRVKVRGMLLWNTNGSMINAAVMGMVSPLRYVMLTDALLESLGREQVLAVMAHEIGHVRRHHMPWLVICLLASFVIAWVPVEAAMIALWWAGVRWTEQSAQWTSMLGSAVELVGGLLIFGWVCRRFERQADTFAVQHLCSDPALGMTIMNTADGSAVPQSPADPKVTPQSALALCSALEVIAELNNVDPERPSWRHGSIAWRQRYLMSLIGRPALRLPIDGLVRSLKLAAVVLIIAGIALEMWRVQLVERHASPQRELPLMQATPTIDQPLTGNAPA